MAKSYSQRERAIRPGQWAVKDQPWNYELFLTQEPMKQLRLMIHELSPKGPVLRFSHSNILRIERVLVRSDGYVLLTLLPEDLANVDVSRGYADCLAMFAAVTESGTHSKDLEFRVIDRDILRQKQRERKSS